MSQASRDAYREKYLCRDEKCKDVDTDGSAGPDGKHYCRTHSARLWRVHLQRLKGTSTQGNDEEMTLLSPRRGPGSAPAPPQPPKERGPAARIELDRLRLRHVEAAAYLMTKHRKSGRRTKFPDATLGDAMTCLDSALEGLNKGHPLLAMVGALRESWGLPLA